RIVPLENNTRVTSFTQSLNSNTSESFIVAEIESLADVPPECVLVILRTPDSQQNCESCPEWNGNKMISSIPHSELTMEMKDYTFNIISSKNEAFTEVTDISSISFQAASIDATVTIVGAADPVSDGSHLRVDAGSLDQGVDVGIQTCTAICYYNYDMGDTAMRRNSINATTSDAEQYTMMQIDDRIQPFSELKGVDLTMAKDGMLEVRLENASIHEVEAVVYDQDRSIISSSPYTCDTLKGSSTGFICQHSFKGRNLPNYGVLVVAFNEDGDVIGSIWQNVHNIIVPSDDGVEDWVIVVSVFSSVFGLAFIIWAVLVVLKKSKIKKDERLLSSPRKDKMSPKG
ncbi:unnamed protein product, partial [Meganyctiphanes norvegica]